MTASKPGPSNRSTPVVTRNVVAGSFARTLVAAAPGPVGMIIAGTACLIAQSAAQWLSGALIVAWFLVLDQALGIPARAWIPTLIRWLPPVAVLVAGGGLLRAQARSGAWISPTVLAEGLVLLVLLAIAGFSRAAARAIPDAPMLTFPLRAGKWCAIEGEGRALNHHWRAPTQRAALDLVRLGSNGMSHRGLRPSRTDAYFAYGTPVYSPCDAVVLTCRDGDPDTRMPGRHPAGNHVILQANGVQILLGHLARGTLLIQTGQTVHTGQELAQVGNSGNSTEPHLHIHAQRDGKPLRLRFADQRRHLPRGATITT